MICCMSVWKALLCNAENKRRTLLFNFFFFHIRIYREMHPMTKLSPVLWDIRQFMNISCYNSFYHTKYHATSQKTEFICIIIASRLMHFFCDLELIEKTHLRWNVTSVQEEYSLNTEPTNFSFAFASGRIMTGEGR